MGKKPNGYWTYERCKEEALKYESRSDFKRKNNYAYISSRKNKWLDEICVHMLKKNKQIGYWTFDRCRETALKCVEVYK